MATHAPLLATVIQDIAIKIMVPVVVHIFPVQTEVLENTQDVQEQVAPLIQIVLLIIAILTMLLTNVHILQPVVMHQILEKLHSVMDIHVLLHLIVFQDIVTLIIG
jgi:hypothetical protein